MTQPERQSIQAANTAHRADQARGACGERVRRTLLPALAGIIAVLALLGTAELASALLGGDSSPLVATGQLAIDLAPHWLKDLMIAFFGTGDKVALFVILGASITVGSALAGWLESRRPPLGSVLLGVAAAVAVFAVLTRQQPQPLIGPVPTLLGAAVGVLVLRAGTARLRRWIAATESRLPHKEAADGIERRRFLGFAATTGALGLIGGIAGLAMSGASKAVSAIRERIALPSPMRPEQAIPAGGQLDVEGISALITPNADFYRIDIALQVPRIDPDGWSLRIHGLVDTETRFTYQDLLGMPLVEHTATIACVSNEVGGDLIGTATWLGVPVRDLLRRAGLRASADMILSSGPDGFSAGTPREALTDPNRQALLAVGMNGEPLPLEHGFPARLIVPGLYGYVSATKWVGELKASRFSDEQGYWTPRGWSARGPVKTQSRIDTPRPGQALEPGTIPIAGVAWAQHTGIAKVEVRVDSDGWREARLSAPLSADTWVQWMLPWAATSGNHTISVRATDASGYTQTIDSAPPAPDGATGWHTVNARVA